MTCCVSCLCVCPVFVCVYWWWRAVCPVRLMCPLMMTCAGCPVFLCVHWWWRVLCVLSFCVSTDDDVCCVSCFCVCPLMMTHAVCPVCLMCPLMMTCCVSCLFVCPLMMTCAECPFCLMSPLMMTCCVCPVGPGGSQHSGAAQTAPSLAGQRGHQRHSRSVHGHLCFLPPLLHEHNTAWDTDCL